MKTPNTKPTYLLNRDSLIVATVIISASEILHHVPEIDDLDVFKGMMPKAFEDWLYELGLDTSQPYIEQKGLTHRNRLNQIVTCSRWVGEERQDAAWINSGYASVEAKDKYSGNKILEDMYRSKNLTKDMQAILEDRDRHTVIDESNWE